MNSQSVLELLATQTWQIAISILAVVLLNRTIAKKRPHLKRILWGIVLIKCLVPPLCSTVYSPLSWLSYAGQSVVQSWNSSQDVSQVDSIKKPAKQDYGYRLVDDEAFHESQSNTGMDDNSRSTLSNWILAISYVGVHLSTSIATIKWQTWLVLCWLASLLTLTGVSAIRYLVFVRRLNRYQRVSNPQVDAMAARLMKNIASSVRAVDTRGNVLERLGPFLHNSGLMKMPETRQHSCFEEMRSETNISSLSPGFAGERAGVRGPNLRAIQPLTPRPPLPEDGERGGKSLCSFKWFAIFRPVSIEVIRGPIGPAVVGFWKPRVVLPECIVKTLSEPELEALILHELIHVRRGDMLWSVAQMIIDAMWWFHPMWWYARRRMNLDMEISCDEETLARTTLAPSAYARCLLRVLEQKQQLYLAPNCPGVKPVEVTQERLESMMQVRQGCHRRSPFWLNLVFIAGCFLLVPGASIGLHGLESQVPETDSQSKPATPELSKDVISKEYDVAALLERLCNETKLDKVRAIDDLIARLIEQPRAFSFNSPDTLPVDEVPKPVVPAASDVRTDADAIARDPSILGASPTTPEPTDTQVIEDSPVRIDNGILYATGTAEFHTELQKQLDDHTQHGFASILAEIVVIQSTKGTSLGFEGDSIDWSESAKGIVAVDNAFLDRFIAHLKKASNKNHTILSCPKILFNSGKSFSASMDYDQDQPVTGMTCDGTIALTESGEFNVQIEVEISRQISDSMNAKTDHAKLPPPIRRRRISTFVVLPMNQGLVLQAHGNHKSFPDDYAVIVKCSVPVVRRTGAMPTLSKNDEPDSQDSPIQLASATQDVVSNPADTHPILIDIRSNQRSRSALSKRSPESEIERASGSILMNGLNRLLFHAKTEKSEILKDRLLELGYSAAISGPLRFELRDSPLAIREIDIEANSLRIEMRKHVLSTSILSCGLGRFTLIATPENKQELDFSLFSKAHFEGDVRLFNRKGLIVAQKIKIDKQFVTMEGDVKIYDRSRFTAKADHVSYDGETYTFTGNASLTVNDLLSAPNVVQADRIQFNLETKEIQTDAVRE